jgi:hypothetical protein
LGQRPFVGVSCRHLPHLPHRHFGCSTCRRQCSGCSNHASL